MAASRWPSHTTTLSAHTRHGRTPAFPARRQRMPAIRDGPFCRSWRAACLAASWRGCLRENRERRTGRTPLEDAFGRRPAIETHDEPDAQFFLGRTKVAQTQAGLCE